MTQGQHVTIKAGWGAKVELFGQFNDWMRFTTDTPAEVERVLPNGDAILHAEVRGKRTRILAKSSAIVQ
jgi:hypothetical protein